MAAEKSAYLAQIWVRSEAAWNDLVVGLARTGPSMLIRIRRVRVRAAPARGGAWRSEAIGRGPPPPSRGDGRAGMTGRGSRTEGRGADCQRAIGPRGPADATRRPVPGIMAHVCPIVPGTEAIPMDGARRDLIDGESAGRAGSPGLSGGPSQSRTLSDNCRY